MKPLIVLLLLCLAAPLAAQDPGSLYAIDADTVTTDDAAGVTTYTGQARARIADLVIEADTIEVFHGDDLPSRLEASGEPLKFHRQASSGDLSGTARQMIFSVADMKLTLIDYVVTDPSGNSMKGGKASFVLSP